MVEIQREICGRKDFGRKWTAWSYMVALGLGVYLKKKRVTFK